MSIMITQGEHLQLGEGKTVQSGQTQTGQDAKETRLTDGTQTKRIEVFEELFHLDTETERTLLSLPEDEGRRVLTRMRWTRM